jgi:hypothetical protein
MIRVAHQHTTPISVLRFPIETDRVRRLMANMQYYLSSQQTERPWVVLWGPGDPARAAVMREHVAAGGHAIALDLGYWQRETSFRVSIDAPHPQAWVMRRDWPTERFKQSGAPTGSAWNPKGPILVAGIGGKAHVQYGGDAVFAWEREQIRECQRRWDRPVLYRRKLPSGPSLTDVPPAPSLPIDQMLKGVSLVITWHSNVAVDAIRWGIPVVCRDGAAAAVCPSTVPDDPRPLDEALRKRFLYNLAWFNWVPSEVGPMCVWLRDLLK